MGWEMLATHNMVFILASGEAINELSGIMIVGHLLILRLVRLNASINNRSLTHQKSLNIGDIALRVDSIVIHYWSQLGTLHKRPLVLRIVLRISMGRRWNSRFINVMNWGIVIRRTRRRTRLMILRMTWMYILGGMMMTTWILSVRWLLHLRWVS